MQYNCCKYRYAYFWGVIFTIWLAFPSSTGLAQTRTINPKANSAKPDFVPGDILVKFKPTSEIKERLALNERQASDANRNLFFGMESIDRVNHSYGLRSIKKLFPPETLTRKSTKTLRHKKPDHELDLSTVYHLKFPEEAPIQEIIQRLKQDPLVEYAQPNYIYRFTETIPNEYPDRSALATEQWALDKIQAPLAWDLNKGSSEVVIAIIDSGVDWKHSDLAGNIWTNPGEDAWGDPNDPTSGNGIDDDGNGYVDDWKGWDFIYFQEVFPGEDPGPPDNDPMDFFGHGTLVSGIAAATTNNSYGMAGVCWNCKIMPLKAGYRNSEGQGVIESSHSAWAVVYAVNNGADVINMSFGGLCWSTITWETIRYAYDHGVILVASAGNSNTLEVEYPAAYEEVISVAATDKNDQKTGFSSYGLRVDVSAPGDFIKTTAMGNSFKIVEGTSAAAPFVSGLAGLIKSQHLDWSNEQVRQQIIGTAQNIDTLNPDYSGLLGSGRIDAFKALSPPSAHISVVDYSYNDGSADANGKIDSGETVNLYVKITNHSAFPLTNVRATLSTGDGYISVVSKDATFNDLAPGQSGYSTVFSIHAGLATPPNHTVSFNLSVQANEGLVSSPFLFPLAKPCHLLGWPKRVIDDFDLNSEHYLGRPVLEDLDHDGDLEIIVLSDNRKIYMFHHDGTTFLPPIELKADIQQSGDRALTVADINSDGVYEFIVAYIIQKDVCDPACNALGLSVLRPDASVLPGWPKVLIKSWRGQSPSVFDVDGDGYLEIFFSSDMIYAWRHDGTPMPGWPIDYNYYPVPGQRTPPAPSFGDIDGDGQVEIVVGSVLEDHQVFAFHIDGTPVTGWPIALPGTTRGMYGGVSIGDLNNDGKLEVVGALSGSIRGPVSNTIYAWTGDGKPAQGWPFYYPDWSGILSMENPALGDLDGDGKIEVALGSDDIESANPLDDNMVMVINHEGTIRPGWPKVVMTQQDESYFGSGTFLADMDGDGNQEIIVQSNDGQTHMLKVDGSEAEGFPWLTSSIPMGAAVGDVDGDGDLELVLSDQTHLYVLTGFGAKEKCKIEWGQYKHDNWYTGLHGFVPPLRQWRPSPGIGDGASGVYNAATLKWYFGDPEASYDVYFGTKPDLGSAEYRGTQVSTEFNPGVLEYSTTYFWRINFKNSAGKTTGKVWSFTTEPAPAKPARAIEPYPVNNAIGVPVYSGLTLTWKDGGGAWSFDVYFGSTPNLDISDFKQNVEATSWYLMPLEHEKTFYWRIDSKNRGGTITGEVWSFTTEPQPMPPLAPIKPFPANNAKDIPVNVTIKWKDGGGAERFDVYFGTNPTLSALEVHKGSQVSTSYTPGILKYATTYYWRIDPSNRVGTITGILWSFTTMEKLKPDVTPSLLLLLDYD
jgi:subtilisin family serine protease